MLKLLEGTIAVVTGSANPLAGYINASSLSVDGGLVNMLQCTMTD